MKIDNKQYRIFRVIIVSLIILLGLILRFYPVIGIDFPLNDGGLFYSMILDLIENNFRLPSYTSYNNANIPFAYPPFGFYISAFLVKLGFNLLDVLHYLPPLVSVFSIGVFYLFSKEIGLSEFQSLISTLIFSVTPTAYMWRIFGGGITRSFGLLFLILFLYQLYRFKRKRIDPLLVIWGTSTFLSHPEAASHLALATAIYFLFHSDKDKVILPLLLHGLAIGLVSSIWWIPVIFRHGVAPFISVFTSGSWETWYEVSINYFLNTQSFQLVFLLLGFLYAIIHRKFAIPCWVIAMIIIFPRGADQYLILPASLLSAVFIDKVIFPGFVQLASNLNAPSEQDYYIEIKKYRNYKNFTLIFTITLLGFFLQGFLHNLIHGVPSMTSEQQQGIEWVNSNIPNDAEFLILGNEYFVVFPFGEWFPALTSRTSILAIQGYEWLPDGLFLEHIQEYDYLQECTQYGLECLNSWEMSNNENYDYLILPGNSRDSVAKEDDYFLLRNSLIDADQYNLVYENLDFYIFSNPD